EKEQAEQDGRGLAGRQDRAAHPALPSTVRRSSYICSPRKSSQVTPAIGQAMWIVHSGSSASSEMRYQPKPVNLMPAHTNTSATARTPSRAISLIAASTRGDSRGQRSTSKCVL